MAGSELVDWVVDVDTRQVYFRQRGDSIVCFRSEIRSRRPIAERQAMFPLMLDVPLTW
jgi:hypothetical protein